MTTSRYHEVPIQVRKIREDLATHTHSRNLQRPTTRKENDGTGGGSFDGHSTELSLPRPGLGNSIFRSPLKFQNIPRRAIRSGMHMCLDLTSGLMRSCRCSHSPYD
jgi:hypothetical protein